MRNMLDCLYDFRIFFDKPWRYLLITLTWENYELSFLETRFPPQDRRGFIEKPTTRGKKKG